jgi:hypothetical protein
VNVYKPSTILRKVRAGEIADPQPRGLGKIMCEEHRHPISGDTESPTFWENGSYVYCAQCGETKLARVQFGDFEIDLTGERTKYPMTLREAA